MSEDQVRSLDWKITQLLRIPNPSQGMSEVIQYYVERLGELLDLNLVVENGELVERGRILHDLPYPNGDNEDDL